MFTVFGKKYVNKVLVASSEQCFISFDSEMKDTMALWLEAGFVVTYEYVNNQYYKMVG